MIISRESYEGREGALSTHNISEEIEYLGVTGATCAAERGGKSQEQRDITRLAT